MRMVMPNVPAMLFDDEDNENEKLVILDDFIDRTTKREQTYYDGTRPEFSRICHIPMYPAFSTELRQLLIETCESIPNLSYHKTCKYL